MKLSTLKYFSVFSLILILLLSILAGSQLKKLKFDYSFESFFPLNDPDLVYYEKLIQEFGQQNDFLFVVFQEVNLKDTSELTSLRNIEYELEKLDYVTKVQSPFDESIFQITPFGLNVINKFPISSPIEFKDPVPFSPHFGKDGTSLLMVLEHETFASKKSSDQFYLNLSEWLELNSEFETTVSGKAQMQSDFTVLLEQELGVLLGFGFLICLVLLTIMFRNLKRVLLTVLVMVLTLLWTVGLMGYLAKPIDVMMVMLPAILLIISVSDSIHLINKYDHLRGNEETNRAITQTISSIGKANFITSITTAIGFLGLFFLPITPIKEFGLWAAMGIIIAFLITMTLIPALLYFFPSLTKQRKDIEVASIRFTSLFTQFGRFSRWATLLITVVIILGVSKLHLNTGLIVGLQRDEPLLEKVRYFDTNFNGFRPIEVGIELSGLKATDSTVIQNIESIEQALKEYYKASSIVSTNSIIKQINSGLYGGSPYYLRPPSAKDLSRIKRYYNNRKLVEIKREVESESGNLLRIVGLTKDYGSSFFHETNPAFEEALQALNTAQFEAKLTGASFLIDKTDRYVIEAIVKGLFFACISVALISLIFFKSWRAAILILVVNAIPLLLLFGLMGLLNIELNISTAIIFTVALGIAVDDSIHFMARYKLEKSRGQNSGEALRMATTFTGKSIIYTTIIMVGGFGALLFSSFSAVYYLGLFICFSALIAFWYDLKVLPYLIKRWHKL